MGVDVGLENVVALSDGTVIENWRWVSRSAARISPLQRWLSRKKKGSHDREKARMKLARARRRVPRQRDDYAHKLSHRLATGNALVVFEELQVREMVKDHNLASAIMDACGGKLRRLTPSKAERRGGRVVLVPPNDTSQKCSRCGNRVPKGLSVWMHEYPGCGLAIERDANASRNILQAHLERASASEAVHLPV